MRDYYLHARGVVQVADRLLESARVPARRRPRIAQVDETFITFNGELALKDPRRFAERPSEMVRLFRVALAEKVAIYGHTRELVAEHDRARSGADRRRIRSRRSSLLDGARRSPRQRRSRRCSRSDAPARHPVGAVMPGWAPCTCARPARPLSRLHGRPAPALRARDAEATRARRARRGASTRDRAVEVQLTRPAPLLLATLLHDVGKPLGKGHAEKGAVIAGQVARRLGLDETDVGARRVPRPPAPDDVAPLAAPRPLRSGCVAAVRRARRQRGPARRALPVHAVRHRDDRARQPDGVEGGPAARAAWCARARYFRGETGPAAERGGARLEAREGPAVAARADAPAGARGRRRRSIRGCSPSSRRARPRATSGSRRARRAQRSRASRSRSTASRSRATASSRSSRPIARRARGDRGRADREPGRRARRRARARRAASRAAGS